MEPFDASYYKRYYENPKTRVSSKSDTQKLAGFVTSYLSYLHVPVRSVLDLGCGLGRWRDALKPALPRASYLGVEHSEYLCERYGFTQGSAADFKSKKQFDLVICQGVLQYLDAKQAARAIENFSTLCRGALYLEALTREDWSQHCDTRKSDGQVHLRPASFYKKRLRRDFIACGGGLYLRRDAGHVLFALEALGQ
jgi:SAM-dependent methyltransferase